MAETWSPQTCIRCSLKVVRRSCTLLKLNEAGGAVGVVFGSKLRRLDSYKSDDCNAQVTRKYITYVLSSSESTSPICRWPEIRDTHKSVRNCRRGVSTLALQPWLRSSGKSEGIPIAPRLATVTVSRLNGPSPSLRVHTRIWPAATTHSPTGPGLLIICSRLV